MVDLNITLWIQLANFLVTLVVLNYLLISPIRKIIRKRKDNVEGLIGEIEAFTAEKQQLLDEYESELRKAREAAAIYRKDGKVMGELLKIFFSSNSVTGAVVMPLIIALAMDIGMNPWILAGPAGIATSMAFIMVTSSPTNVIPYSSGYFRISEFAKSGVVMTIIGILAVTASVAIFGRFANMNIW